jgi:hypothetical protein
MGRYDDLATTADVTANGDEYGLALDPSWLPVDLAPVVAGDCAQPVPTILHRDDDQALIYLGEVNGCHGPSGEGKGWLTLYAVVEQLRRGHAVVLVDLEDNPTSIIARLRLLGATNTEIVERLVYVRPTSPFGLIEIEHLALIVEERRPSLVIVDSLGEAFGLDGIDENSDAEVGPWLRRVARRIAELGPAVWAVDHSTKANDNKLFPSGSKRKRAAITGASYLVEATTPLVAGKGGRLRITCAKDRHGTYRRGEHVADLVMTVDPLGTRVKLYTPDLDGETEPVHELAVRAAVKAALAEGRPVSGTALVAAMKIKAAKDTKWAGVDLATSRGLLHETAGPRRARMFEAVHEGLKGAE